MIAELTTSQRMVTFYIQWFNRCYQPTDSGWVIARTPDDQSVSQQPAFFWFALEAIARSLNEMRAVELAAMTKK